MAYQFDQPSCDAVSKGEKEIRGYPNIGSTESSTKRLSFVFESIEKLSASFILVLVLVLIRRRCLFLEDCLIIIFKSER